MTVDNETFMVLVEYRNLDRLVESLEGKGKELSYKKGGMALSLFGLYMDLARTVRLQQGAIRNKLGYTDIDKFNELLDKELGRQLWKSKNIKN